MKLEEVKYEGESNEDLKSAKQVETLLVHKVVSVGWKRLLCVLDL
jgi:hypothetical protein